MQLVDLLTSPYVGLSTALVGVFFALLPWLDRDSTRVRRAAFLVMGLLAMRYALWRILAAHAGAILRSNYVGTYSYLIFELYFLLVSVLTFRSWTRYTARSSEADRHAKWYETRASPPLVDFFIPSYNENFAILERAITGGLAQDYPRVRVWVLDDGRREWLKELAAAKGVNYLTRADNSDYKAGNLNHAMRHIARSGEPSEFIAVLDCDFTASPSFVTRALSLMHDETVGIVQTNQVYFNLDPFQYSLGVQHYLVDWQRMPFDFDSPCRDARGEMTCCGTCFLGRVSGIERIGGIPTESVAEDRLTTYALKTLGLKTVYLNESVSYGIVAEGVHEFLTQVGRWCLGTVQNIHSKWGGASPQLAWWQRALFVEQTVFWATCCLAKILQLWLPVIFFFFGPAAFPVQGTGEQYFAFFAPFWVFSLVLEYWLTRGTGGLPIVSDAKLLLQAPVVLRATLLGLSKSKNQKFVVTDKGILRDRTYIHWYAVKWPIAVGIMTVAGLVYSIVAPYAPGQNSALAAFAYFWSLYNLLSIAVAMAVCVEPPQRRAEERFDALENAMINVNGESWPATVLNISMEGALLRTAAPLPPGGSVTIVVQGVSELAATAVRNAGAGRVAVMFSADSKQRAELVHKLFCEKYVRPATTGRFSGIYRGVLSKVFI